MRQIASGPRSPVLIRYTCSAGSTFFCGQTFTVPTTSTVLQSFAYQLQTANVLSFELYAMSGNQVVGAHASLVPVFYGDLSLLHTLASDWGTGTVVPRAGP